MYTGHKASILLALARLAFLCLPESLNAQLLTSATLSGTVTDPSGAGVPAAQVTLQNTLQNASRVTLSGSTGAYVIAAIEPGTYKLVVKAGVFETTIITDIVLTAGQGSTLNVSLKLANVATQVQVSSAPPLLNTTTAAVGGLATSREFTNLPMLGRNFTSLVDLLPAAAPIPNGDTGYNISGVGGLALTPAVFGQKARDSAYSLDGAPNTTPEFSRIAIIPPPEAMQEMKVSSAMDTGAFGWSSGPEITVITKSGTNKYHGDAWEYIRNNDLNARSFFQPSVGPYKWNQFGFTGGGPVQIPHVLSKEKAWYIFGYYEGIRLHTSSNFTALVPTSAQLNGNFAGGPPIYDPFTTVVDSTGQVASRTPFANNQIPSSMINQTSLALAKALYPGANLPAGAIPGVNFYSSNLNTSTSDQYSVRVDHQFGNKDSFYGRWSDWYYDSVASSNPVVPAFTNTHYSGGVASDTHVFSPTFMITARYSVVRYDSLNLNGGPGPKLNAQLGLQSIWPAFEGNANNLYVSGVSPAGYLGLSSGTQGFYGPEYYQVGSADAQKTVGRHSIWFGGSFTWIRMATDQTNGALNFSAAQTAFGANTGDSMASFMLGLPTSGSRLGKTFQQIWHNYMPGLYLQDQFRATHKLTINYGVRWDPRLTPRETPGLGTFDYVTGQFLWDHTNPITGAPANVRQGLVAPDYNNFQPRFGIAYQLSPKMVVRSSYGIYDNIFGISQQLYIGVGKNWPWAFPQSVSSLNQPLPTTILPNIYPGPAVGAPVPTGCNQCGNSDVSSSRQPYVQEWTISVQRQLVSSTMVEAAYFGSHGVRQTGVVVVNSAPVPGTTPLASRLPFPNFPTSAEAGWNELNSSYNGTYLQARKTYSHNLTFLLNYTWSKTLDDGADSIGGGGGPLGVPSFYTTTWNTRSFRGPASFDVRHLFNASYVYDIPVATGSQLLDAVIAHWNLSGAVSAQTGAPTYVFLTFDNENVGVTSASQEFPNLISNPVLAKPTIQQWFNTSAYQLPTFGTRGDAGKHAIYSDGLANWDSSLSKRWPLESKQGAGETRAIEFRAEFFNSLNGHSFDPPGALLGTPSFGKVSGTYRQGGRQIQFALKLHF